MKQLDKLEFDKGGMVMKRITGQRIFLLVSIIAPLLFLLMYFPIWNGKEILLSDTITTALFVFQCVSAILATVHLFLHITAKKVCVTVSVILNCVAIFSIILTCFLGFFFMLELLNIPWFPAQD